MDKWDGIAMMSFIACDIIIENSNELKMFYKYKLDVLEYEMKDILKRLFR